MKRSFNTARRTGTTVPRIQAINFETNPAQSFVAGALLSLNANGNVQEAAQPPVSIVGIALQAASTGPGYDISDASKTQVYTGRQSWISVALADEEEDFSCRGVNGGTDPVVPTQANIGQQYGVGKSADGSWYLDLANQAQPVCQVVDIDVDKSIFFVRFLKNLVTTP